MKQLKVKDITFFIQQLKIYGMTSEEIDDLPIYLSDDDELNGIHNAWNIDLLDKKDNDESIQWCIEMIDENSGTTDLKDKGILLF